MQRKDDHLQLALDPAQIANERAWWPQVLVGHNALPEIALDDVLLSSSLPGACKGFPLMLAGMTGGTKDAARINQTLATVCEKMKLPMGLGSMRPLLLDPGAPGYQLKKSHPDLVLYGNIGATQLVEEERDRFGRLLAWMDELCLDAFCVHLNPAQELMQPEGDRDFSGVLDAVTHLVERSSKPLIVKETGAGLSVRVVQQLVAAGVDWMDISGAGGTSWTWIENARSDEPGHGFDQWGLPCPAALAAARNAQPEASLIASGGIRNGVDAVKALVLGADLVAIARPALSAASRGQTELQRLLEQFGYEMRAASLLLGCTGVQQLRQQPWRFCGDLRCWEQLLRTSP